MEDLKPRGLLPFQIMHLKEVIFEKKTWPYSHAFVIDMLNMSYPRLFSLLLTKIFSVFLSLERTAISRNLLEKCTLNNLQAQNDKTKQTNEN